MKKFFLSLFVLSALVVSTSASSNERLDYSPLKLTSEKLLEFRSLPIGVQKLMINEARFVKRMKKMNKSTPLDTMMGESKRRGCDEPDDSTISCIPTCSWRSSSGDCVTYGDDLCGRNPSCTEVCSWRSSSGDCVTYGDDICTAD